MRPGQKYVAKFDFRLNISFTLKSNYFVLSYSCIAQLAAFISWSHENPPDGG